VVYLTFGGKASGSGWRVATHTHAVKQVVEFLLFMHDGALGDSSTEGSVAHHVIDAVILLGPPTKGYEVIVWKKLDLENVVPERAKGEVDRVIGCLLIDEWIDEIVLMGQWKADIAVVLPGTWFEGK
jgi:hypothetical protein